MIQMTEDHTRQKLLGYPDRFSARQGENITFFVSAPKGEFSAEVYRLISVDNREGAGGIKHELMSSRLSDHYEGTEQKSSIGGYAEFFDPALPARGLPLSLTFAFRPTLLPGTEEVLISFDGNGRSTALKISERTLKLAVSGSELAKIDLTLAKHGWYRVALVVEDGAARLSAAKLTTLGRAEEIRYAVAVLPKRGFFPSGFDGHVTIAASTNGVAAHKHFTGKIAEVVFAGAAISEDEIKSILNGAAADDLLGTRVIYSWSMGKNTAPMVIPNDVSGAPALTLLNLPMRAVTGSRWRGSRHHPELVPDEYNAVFFHRDMVAGGDWKPSLDLEIDVKWRSGVYALRVWDGTDEDWIPFYVRPAAGSCGSKVVFLAPTNTYLAYGNEHRGYLANGFSTKDGPVHLQDADRYAEAHPELGLSLYNTHEDGAGVAYASRLRPLLNFRPFHFNWLNDSYRHFAGDFYILDWLEHHRIGYDVLTDEDLHREGLTALQPYDVVITGSHPEYISERMMNALQEYVEGGRNLMYLGGNGFYWATSFHPDLPHVIEVRRGHNGLRNYTSQPGETVHASTGEQGGLWRNRGRAPQRLTGIGTGACGWGKAAPYKLSIHAKAPEHAWIFDGVTDELVGTEGMMLGGAAGDEIDRVDDLGGNGTPPETTVLATSVGLPNYYQPVAEDYTYILPGDQGGSENPLVRADMTWLSTKSGGAVFSVGSICWIGCLPIKNYVNPISRITLNVLNRFITNR
ncbi:N,N-dimethylformamidase [Bradyrhizobium niftali]